MPELYDNDWHPDNTDHTSTGLHIKAMDYYTSKERTLTEDPNYLWTSVTWDDGIPSNGRRGASVSWQKNTNTHEDSKVMLPATRD